MPCESKGVYIMIKTINSENFDQAVLKSESPVLVDFYAKWCGPCQQMTPVVEEIADELDGKISVGKIDVDADSELARKFSVMSIPTLIIFSGGAPIKRVSGFRDVSQLTDIIAEACPNTAVKK